jgi:hypothetical protein
MKNTKTVARCLVFIFFPQHAQYTYSHRVGKNPQEIGTNLRRSSSTSRNRLHCTKLELHALYARPSVTLWEGDEMAPQTERFGDMRFGLEWYSRHVTETNKSISECSAEDSRRGPVTCAYPVGISGISREHHK